MEVSLQPGGDSAWLTDALSKQPGPWERSAAASLPGVWWEGVSQGRQVGCTQKDALLFRCHKYSKATGPHLLGSSEKNGDYEHLSLLFGRIAWNHLLSILHYTYPKWGAPLKKGKLTFRNTVEQSLWMALYKFLNDVYAVSFSGRAVKEHVGNVLCFCDCIKDQKIWSFTWLASYKM